MLLAIDVGNTNVVLGLFEGAKLLRTWRLGTHAEYTSDECAAILRSLFDVGSVDPAAVSDAIISCVVPPLLPIFERTCTKSFGCQPLVVGPLASVNPNWSKEGRYLAYHLQSPRDIWYLTLGENSVPVGEPVPFLDSEAVEDFPTISPDGR